MQLINCLLTRVWMVLWMGVLWNSAGRAEMIPFVLPWDDTEPAAWDFSNAKAEITEQRRVTLDASGHLSVEGARIRFLGMNFAGDSPFMPTNHADAVAGRLAKFGINGVRMHHMDAPWAAGGGLIDYHQGNSRSLRPAALERLHFLVSRLKAHGIYVDLNLLVGRVFKAADGLPAEVEAMDWKDQHILGFFDDTALTLHKEYATALMTPVNPFTRFSLAKDPAVAFVEIQNENGLIQKWLDRGLDRLPAIFARKLQSRWNDWLVARYSNTRSLSEAWKVVSEPLGESMLKNGNFLQGTEPWILETQGGARATMRSEREPQGQSVLKVGVEHPGREGWHVQWNHTGLKVEESRWYSVSCLARAMSPVGLEISVMQAHANWQTVGYAATWQLSNQWRRIDFSFQASVTDSAVRLNFGGLGLRTNTVWLADVQFRPGGQSGRFPVDAPDSALERRSIPLLRFGAEGYRGTTEARRDWIRFLIDLETRYWTTMRNHLQKECGYPGLVFGTIVGNSPAHVQAGLDVIDAHAYWQHPVFGSKDWDPKNWSIQNVSMVNAIDNTLTGLARQRILGRPFFVTEYQHPSPNLYGAEAPLLVAAFAAFQDWDGLWFFDYGAGEQSAPMGAFRGFFDTGQHPSKMANLVIASELFRRGDVAPGTTTIRVPMNQDREIELLASKSSAWNVVSAGHLGLVPEWAMTRKVGFDLAGDQAFQVETFSMPLSRVLTSETRQWIWDGSIEGRSVIRIDTPKSKVLMGFTDEREFDFDPIRIRPGKTRLGWSTIAMSLVKGSTWTNESSALLVVSGEVSNTGMRWTDRKRTSVGDQWGRSPTLVEVVPATLTLSTPSDRLKVWTLNDKGQRDRVVPVRSVDAGHSILSLEPSTGSLWYAIDVGPAFR